MEKTFPSLVENLTAQRESYLTLLQHQDRQQRALAEDDDEALMDCIKAKNEVIQKLHRLEREAQKTADRLDPGQRARLSVQTEPLRETILDALERLIAAEEKSREILIEKQSRLQQELVDFRKKKDLFQGYTGPPPKGGNFSRDA